MSRCSGKGTAMRHRFLSSLLFCAVAAPLWRSAAGPAGRAQGDRPIGSGHGSRPHSAVGAGASRSSSARRRPADRTKRAALPRVTEADLLGDRGWCRPGISILWFRAMFLDLRRFGDTPAELCRGVRPRFASLAAALCALRRRSSDLAGEFDDPSSRRRADATTAGASGGSAAPVRLRYGSLRRRGRALHRLDTARQRSASEDWNSTRASARGSKRTSSAHASARGRSSPLGHTGVRLLPAAIDSILTRRRAIREVTQDRDGLIALFGKHPVRAWRLFSGSAKTRVYWRETHDGISDCFIVGRARALLYAACLDRGGFLALRDRSPPPETRSPGRCAASV